MKAIGFKLRGLVTLLVLTIGLVSWNSDVGSKDVVKEESVAVLNIEKGFTAAIKMDFEIEYTAKNDREVAIELREDGKWIGGKVMQVEKGTNKGVISIKFKKAPKAGSNHEIRINIRPKGTTWKEALNGNSYKNVVLH